jgi:hypothetical protein
MTNKSGTAKAPKGNQCWVNFGSISEELLAELKAEPFVTAAAQGEDQMAALLASLRRETVETPVIFVGAGTCGLGAGAAKTLDQEFYRTEKNRRTGR